MEVALHLAAKYGQRVKLVEPNLRKLPCAFAAYGTEMVSIDEALRSCEIALLLVDHDEFKMVSLAERRHLDVIDTRGIWQDMPART
jgi:UDP-N-acetyl-D-mannosaminuronic acid dehydrogenase